MGDPLATWMSSTSLNIVIDKPIMRQLLNFQAGGTLSQHNKNYGSLIFTGVVVSVSNLVTGLAERN